LRKSQRGQREYTAKNISKRLILNQFAAHERIHNKRSNELKSFISKITIELTNRDCLSNNIIVQSSRSKAKGIRHFFFLLDTRQRKENRGNARMTRHETSSGGEQKSNERVLFSICITHHGALVRTYERRRPCTLTCSTFPYETRNRMPVIER